MGCIQPLTVVDFDHQLNGWYGWSLAPLIFKSCLLHHKDDKSVRNLKSHCTWLQGHKHVMLTTLQSAKRSDASRDLKSFTANNFTWHRMERIPRSYIKPTLKHLDLNHFTDVFFVPSVTNFVFSNKSFSHLCAPYDFNSRLLNHWKEVLNKSPLVF